MIMHLKPILNMSLPQQFRQIRLELAREPDHPQGDSSVGYIVIAPLTPDGRIDHELWKDHREACRVTRLRPDENNDSGHLIRRPGGTWAFRYDDAARLPDEAGYHFADEHFVPGEYVSINEGGTMHTYCVKSIARL
ncbi:hypothetical protein [Nitrobacter sp.]|uniref:hypothetical protein n=1 Tax=Nitrobacter sp. TaxID=29420 RepID=UPI001D84D36E|nr:hypothetical protein [Nitrobacter sp.]MCB1393364.1 hypothetical protein [Nitrobacter sp.]